MIETDIATHGMTIYNIVRCTMHTVVHTLRVKTGTNGLTHFFSFWFVRK